MDLFSITYNISVGAEEIDLWATSLLLEQTVETPLSVASRYDFVRENLTGKIENITPDGSNGFHVTISIPSLIASQSPAQFLNVLFGNVSLHEHVTLADFSLSPPLQQLFSGPEFGIPGIRKKLGVWDRPLTCSALKPIGLSPSELAALCSQMAEGGIDIIKDDHYLADHPFCPFEERVHMCHDVVEEISSRLGRKIIYAPHVSGSPDDIKSQIDFAQRLGVGALLVTPMLIGLPLFHELKTRHIEVPVLAHPSFGGAARILEPTLYGKLFRIFGADAVIFPNYGGRFSYPESTCLQIAENLRLPFYTFSPAFPVPAGGMKLERVPELVQFFGNDVMLLVGGSLLEAGEALKERTDTFLSAVISSSRHTHSDNEKPDRLNAVSKHH